MSRTVFSELDETERELSHLMEQMTLLESKRTQLRVDLEKQVLQAISADDFTYRMERQRDLSLLFEMLQKIEAFRIACPPANVSVVVQLPNNYLAFYNETLSLLSVVKTVKLPLRENQHCRRDRHLFYLEGGTSSPYMCDWTEAKVEQHVNTIKQHIVEIYKTLPKSDTVSRSHECKICLTADARMVAIAGFGGCGHTMCADCLGKIMSADRKCPFCRKQVFFTYDIYL